MAVSPGCTAAVSRWRSAGADWEGSFYTSKGLVSYRLLLLHRETGSTCLPLSNECQEDTQRCYWVNESVLTQSRRVWEDIRRCSKVHFCPRHEAKNSAICPVCMVIKLSRDLRQKVKFADVLGVSACANLPSWWFGRSVGNSNPLWVLKVFTPCNEV